MFTDLETLFFKQGKTPEEDERARQALQYAMQSSLENKAVLSYELAPELGFSQQEIEQLIDSLDNNNARKWYIKAMMAVGNAETSDDDFMELVNRYGADEALRMKDNQTPTFLAYLQRAFDIEPAMLRRLYASDVHIDEETRKKYPYDPKLADTYRAKFQDITK